jgi:hypothetical protein
MIFTMPKNQSIQNLFAPDGSNTDKVIARLKEGVTAKGYVLGELGVFPCGIGDICVDADRDPSDDWAVFVPPTQSTKEVAESTNITKALTALTRAKAGTLSAAGVQETLAFLLQAELERRGVAIP